MFLEKRWSRTDEVRRVAKRSARRMRSLKRPPPSDIESGEVHQRDEKAEEQSANRESAFQATENDEDGKYRKHISGVAYAPRERREEQNGGQRIDAVFQGHPRGHTDN